MDQEEGRLFAALLGSGTALPHPDRSAPGLVVRTGCETLLIDPGPAALSRMAGLGIPYQSITRLFFSHYHPDHAADFVMLLLAMRIDPTAPERIEVRGPLGLRRFVQSWSGLYPEWIPDVLERLTLSERPSWNLDIGEWRLRAIPVEHSSGAVGFRFEGPKGGVLAYSGDTDECGGLLEILAGADEALLEVSHPDALKMPGHLSGAIAGRAAAAAGVHRLWAIHRYPACDSVDILGEIRAGGFGGEARLAHDGLVLTLD